jgi:Spy/CpxP family protein refolding chaperone
MKKSILIITVCVLALPLFAWSQGIGQGLGPGQGRGLGPGQGQGLGPGQEDRIELAPWWDRPVVRDLGLSEDQLRQISDIVRESRDHLIQLRANVRMAEGRLADAMSTEKVDEGSARAAIDNVVAARSELMRATSQMSLKLRQVLTFSQWQELRKRGAQRILSEAGRRQRTRPGN